MSKIRGIWNRIVFFPFKTGFKFCGSQTLFEAGFEIEGAKHITIGSRVRAKPRFHLAAISYHNGKKYEPIIVINDGVSINYDVHIAAINKVIIGEDTLIASKVFITDHFHGDTTFDNLIIPPSERILVSKGPVIIGKNVWIGEGVSIMPGVTIGNNSIIGANSVVTKSIPAYSVACGVPARIIKNVEKQ